MKTLLLALLLCLPAFSAPPLVKVAWDDPGPEQRAIISHYRLHLGTVSGAYSVVKDLPSSSNGTFSGTLEDLVIGTAYFSSVTAVGLNGLESDYSNEITFTVSPTPDAPSGLRIDVTVTVTVTPSP